MTQPSKATLNSYFETDDVPTQAQFQAVINSIPKGMVLMVAASNADPEIIASADYVCDGVDDQAEINAAVARLLSLGTYKGGTIELSPGDFYLTATLSFNSWQPVWLKGQGARTTILHWTLSSPGACIKLSETGVTQQMRLTGFYVDGDDTNTQYGIYCGANCAYNYFFDIAIYDITDTSFYSESGFSQCYIEHVRVRDPVNFGFDLHLTACTLVDCYVLGGETATGFRVKAFGASLVNCVTDHVALGFDFPPPCQSISIVGAYTEACIRGVHVGGGWLSNAVTFLGGAFATRSGALGSGTIEVYDSDTVSFIGVGVDTQVDLPSFYIHSGTTNCRILNCWPGYVQGGRPTNPYVVEPGASVDIDDVMWHPTKNKGATTIAGGGTIAHGLIATPANIQAVGSVAGEIVSVTAKNATTFTVAVRKYDGTSGTSQTIYWRAET